MKKNIRRTVVVTALVVTMAMPNFTFAAVATAKASEATATAPKTLTLEQAFAGLKDSPQMAYIEIQYNADKGAVAGYSEGASKAKENAEILGDNSGQLINETARDFSKNFTEPNKQARLNALNTSLTETYYGVKNVEAMANIAKENLDIAQSTYDQTALKYKLGKASKLDTLNAQNDLAKAKNTYQKAQDGLSQARMGFNIYMGYDLLHQVSLTSEVKEIALPTIKLEEAIAQAKANRLEIKGSEYQLKMAKVRASNYTAYPRSSATYLAGANAILGAETALKQSEPKVEMDVRTKYMTMKEKYSEVQAAKISVSNSKEVLRLTRLQYSNGITTLNTVKQAQLAYISSKSDEATALLDYNLAVQAFTYSYGYGTEAVSL